MAIEPRPVLTVRLDAIAENYRTLTRLSTAAECAAVCKANGYGLGTEAIGPTLVAAGARTFFVATVEEGARLREHIGSVPNIFILNGATFEEFGELCAHQLWPVLSTPTQLEDACRYGRQLDRPVPSALHVDTGMNRLGLAPSELTSFHTVHATDPQIDVRLIMSHLACGEDLEHPLNAQQRQSFAAVVNSYQSHVAQPPLSLAATAGIFLGSAYHYQMTRPGIGLYGGYDFSNMQHVVTLEAPVVQLRDIPAGAVVGYGASWVASRPARIATLPIGYADGVLRQLSNVGKVYINGQAAPMVGWVNMDLLTVDVTDRPGIVPGTMVEIIGPHQSLGDVATAAGTITHEVLTALRNGRYRHRCVGRTNN